MAPTRTATTERKRRALPDRGTKVAAAATVAASSSAAGAATGAATRNNNNFRSNDSEHDNGAFQVARGGYNGHHVERVKDSSISNNSGATTRLDKEPTSNHNKKSIRNNIAPLVVSVELEEDKVGDDDGLDKSTNVHLWGYSKAVAMARLDELRMDDQQPNLAGLNEKQKLALEKRQKKKQQQSSGGATGGDHKNKALVARLSRHETKRAIAVEAAMTANVILQTDQIGLVQAEHDMERTTALSQLELKRLLLQRAESAQDETDAAAAGTARHIYDLTLSQTAPYGIEYDRSGRYSVMYGQGGHVAIMDCHIQCLVAEFYLSQQERVRDACFLHNGTLVAVAQKTHAYIYDHTGAEIHKLSDHTDPFALQFLPYHWLLASIGRAGYLKYQDTSTGQLVSQHRTQLGPCHVIRQNPCNAVLHAGHANGTVTLWSPAQSKYLVKILCHKGAAVHSLAIDPTGRVMVTGGADRQVRVWDLRMYQPLHAYYTVAGVPSSIDISQRGILGIGHAGHATFWSPSALSEKAKDPYMHHMMPGCGPVKTIRFRPYEDVCGIGHAQGIASIVIPGSGEPAIDTMEYNTNPLQDKKQRQEAEVRALLDKLRPEMIALDADVIGGIEVSDPHRRLERVQDLQEAANNKNKSQPIKKEKNRKRGRSKIQSKLRRKKKNIVDQNTIKLREAREKEKSAAATAAAAKRNSSTVETPKDSAPLALKRFF